MRTAAATIAVLALLAVVVVATGVAEPPRQEPPPPPPAPPPTVVTDPAPPGPPGLPGTAPAPPAPAPVAAAPVGPSRAVGLPWRGRLLNGRQLPEVGGDWLTWDPVLKQIPNRPERRWGTAKLLRTIRTVLAGYHLAHPRATQVLIGDLSRPHGGVFDQRFGGLGHASHQNGLDADIYYPRMDGMERRPFKPSQVDRELAQDLVDRFVEAGAIKVFVGPKLNLKGPKNVVIPLIYHDDHLHVRVR